MNRTNIPPKKIKNKMYENQNDKLASPVVQQIKIVCNKSPSPIARGWDNRKNRIEVAIIKG